MKDNYTEGYYEIGGIKQYLLEYQSEENLPVVLYLHGGPGQSQSAYAYYLWDYWKNYISIVFWDQRGAGKTLIYNFNECSEITLDVMISDTFEVIQYIKKKYKTSQVGIMAHSWGTFLGTLFIKKYPDELFFYIGIGQIVDIYKSEIRIFERLRNMIKEKGENEELLEVDYWYQALQDKSDKAWSEFKNFISKMKYKVCSNKSLMKLNWGILMNSPILSGNDYIDPEAVLEKNINLMNVLKTKTLFDEISEFKIPIFYILGEQDLDVDISVAEEYFNTLKSPLKKIYTIKGAGHMLMVEEPLEFSKVLNDICNSMSLRCKRGSF